ncbi:hypothetical protein AB0N64_10985 [Microbacterium sp. NPDC089318]
MAPYTPLILSRAIPMGTGSLTGRRPASAPRLRTAHGCTRSFHPTKIDSDDDSMTDTWETVGWTSLGGQRYRSDPLLPDSDGDHLRDDIEAGQLVEQRGSRVVFATFSDPLSGDSDGDGLSDLEEADLSLNPFEADTDGDGLQDHREVHALGTAADLTDTDGDTFSDALEVEDAHARGLDPLRPDIKTEVVEIASDFALGAFAGELAPGDSVAWLAGNLMSGASSTVPVAGWLIGGAADARDLVAASTRADWVSASYSVIGLIPATGDAFSVPLKITKFLMKNPHLVGQVCQLILDADWLDETSKIKAIAATAPQAWNTLSQSVSARNLYELVNRGTDLRALSDNLARSNHVEAGPAPFFTATAHAEQRLAAMLDAESTRVTSRSEVFSTAGCGGRCNAAARKADVLAGGIAHEAKLGFVRLTPSIEKQIRSDAYLVRTGKIDGAHWHFFASTRTNSIGASTAVLDLLDDLDIAYTTHLPE